MRTFLLGLGLALAAAPGMADPVTVSQRPAARAEAAVTEAERAAQAGLEPG